MGGGLMQLVAYGAQDVYLTGNPQITFFKVVYRRHTNFSMETIEHTLNGNPDFGRKSMVTITRNGDLATKVYLRVVLNAWEPDAGVRAAWVRRVGHHLIDNVEVEIGGSRIDKQYGTWLDVWYELARPVGDRERGYNKMIGDVPELTELNNKAKPQCVLFVPLQFWFNRNTGLALPLIALQYHEVRLHFEFTPARFLLVQDNRDKPQEGKLTMQDASILVDYIYLDSEERRRFAQVGHEYLIEQLQFTGTESVDQRNAKFRLGFNHPTKELIWAARAGHYVQGRPFLAYTHEVKADGTPDWSSALDEAAKNLICCRFVLGAAPANTESTQVSPDGDIIDCVVVDVDDQTYNGAPEINYVSSWDVTVCVNSMGMGTSLFSKIEAATVKLTITEVDGEAQLECKVFNVSHSLHPRDVSLPTDIGTPFVLDTRPLSCKTNDVSVYSWSNYGLLIDGQYNPVDRALIQLNGHDRFDTREGDYFNYVQPDQHHTNTPADGINVYSFALHPEQHQPSGTANLSRIDNTQLNLTFADQSARKVTDTWSGCEIPFTEVDSQLYIFGWSYNVLRIMSGMGGFKSDDKTHYHHKLIQKIFQNILFINMFAELFIPDNNIRYEILVKNNLCDITKLLEYPKALITKILKKFNIISEKSKITMNLKFMKNGQSASTIPFRYLGSETKWLWVIVNKINYCLRYSPIHEEISWQTYNSLSLFQLRRFAYIIFILFCIKYYKK
ncbi:MAG: hypothetical protein CMF62_00295 [Magnetococcales bacterium]|nr:hypothetical protein [Magnetococcales bacterium]|tara:strand:- start:8085 stop:10268 length:2184 start_codon:yes stop_codon:yes gene_type:complete